MFPILQIGPLSIQAPALFMLIAVWIGLFMAEKTSPYFGVSPNELNNLTFYAAIGLILGARLVFLLRYPNVFLDQPLSIFSLSPLMLDWEGGILAGVLVALVYGQRKGLLVWETLDALTPAFAVLVVGWGLARLASGDGYGLPTTLPWGIPLWGANRHPTQVYEILAGLGNYALVMRWVLLKKKRKWAGEVFLRFIAVAAGANLLIDTLRADTPVWQNGLHTVQIASWLVLALCLFLVTRFSAKESV